MQHSLIFLFWESTTISVGQPMSVLSSHVLPMTCEPSVEYMDNRLSRYSMKMGKCEITGIYLFASDVYCHHFIPLYLGGSDKFNNMRILHKEIYELVHHTHNETIEVLINKLGITDLMKIKINQYRDKYGFEPV